MLHSVGWYDALGAYTRWKHLVEEAVCVHITIKLRGEREKEREVSRPCYPLQEYPSDFHSLSKPHLLCLSPPPKMAGNQAFN